MSTSKPHTTVATRSSGIRDDWLAQVWRRRSWSRNWRSSILTIIYGTFLPTPICSPDLLADTGSGHNIESTVFIECTACYRAEAPPELRPLGETEFANGIAAMSASGGYGPTRVAAGIVGLVDLTLGARAEELLRAHMAAAGAALQGHPSRGGLGGQDAEIHNSHTNPPPHLYRDHAAFREGFQGPGQARPQLRRLAVPSADRRSDCARARLSRSNRSCSIMSADRSALAGMRASETRFLLAGGGICGSLPVAPTCTSSLAALACASMASTSIIASAAILAGAGRCLAALCRDLHRGLRADPLHVREQLPGRQDLGLVCGLLECIQTAGGGCLRAGKGGALPRHGQAVLSLGLERGCWRWLGGFGRQPGQDRLLRRLRAIGPGGKLGGD